jgi:protein LSM12
MSRRIKLTTAAPHSQTYEGSLFTADPVLNIVAINTRSVQSASSANAKVEPGDYHVIPVSRIQSFQVQSLPSTADNGASSFAAAQPAIGPVDVKRLEERERAKINKLKEAEQHRGKGVTKEAQAIYDSFKRMYV